MCVGTTTDNINYSGQANLLGIFSSLTTPRLVTPGIAVSVCFVLFCSSLFYVHHSPLIRGTGADMYHISSCPVGTFVRGSLQYS